MLPDVSIIACNSYTPDIVQKALENLFSSFGGLDWVKPGMKIAIKVNLVAALKPEAAGTTHPTVVEALVRLLSMRNAQAIIGDSPGGPYTASWLSHVYHTTGMNLLESSGARLNQDFSQRTANFPEAYSAKTFQYTRYLDEVDAIINVCKLKSHGMMGMSAAVKNMFGVVPGTLKPEYHFKYSTPQSFAHMLVDLNEYFKPQLSIVDAIVGMEGNGPTKGNPRQIGALMASFSPYHLDLACAKIMGVSMQDVPTLEAAFERNLAPQSAEELVLHGDISQLILPDFDRIINRNGLLFQGNPDSVFGRIRSKVLQTLIAANPIVIDNKCIGCGKCAQVCPVHTIEMKNNLPKIHRKDCIRCFCCQEFCPAGAMIVKRRPIAKLINP